VLANDKTVSLGRDRKRLIRATMHRATLGQLTQAEALRLAGNLAFVNAVEPDFLARLERKYGIEVLNMLKRLQADAGG
jgi:hypothetical protein